MARGSEFQEIISGVFALIVFVMIGSTIATTLSIPFEFGGIMFLVFIVGVITIGLALLINILKLFDIRL